MSFGDDEVLVDQLRDGANAKLERWLEALESKGFKLNCKKIEYIDFNLLY